MILLVGFPVPEWYHGGLRPSELGQTLCTDFL